VVITIAESHSPLVLEAELLEELASPTIPLGGLAGDPGALQLIEGVLHDARN